MSRYRSVKLWEQRRLKRGGSRARYGQERETSVDELGCRTTLMIVGRVTFNFPAKPSHLLGSLTLSAPTDTSLHRYTMVPLTALRPRPTSAPPTLCLKSARHISSLTHDANRLFSVHHDDSPKRRVPPSPPLPPPRAANPPMAQRRLHRQCYHSSLLPSYSRCNVFSGHVDGGVHQHQRLLHRHVSGTTANQDVYTKEQRMKDHKHCVEMVQTRDMEGYCKFYRLGTL